jgi:hypothetical protein
MTRLNADAAVVYASITGAQLFAREPADTLGTAAKPVDLSMALGTLKCGYRTVFCDTSPANDRLAIGANRLPEAGAIVADVLKGATIRHEFAGL